MEKTVWNQQAVPVYPALESSITCDIAIIGGGLSGLHLAYLLRNSNINVCLFEANRIAHSNSGKNTGKITIAQDLVYHQIIERYGFDTAYTLSKANTHAFNRLQKLIHDEKIACDYTVCDNIIYTTQKENVKKLQKELDACVKLELPCTFTDQLRDVPDAVGALVMKNQARYNPYEFATALAAILQKSGVQIYENTPITRYQKEDGTVTLYTAHQQTIKATKVVVATGYPCFDDGNLYFVRLPAVRSYIVAQENQPQPLKDMYINCDDPTFSFRSYQHYTLACGSDHKVGEETPAAYDSLRQLAFQHFHLPFSTFSFSAQDYMTYDHLPYAGYLSGNTKTMYVMSGYNQWGNVNALVCAITLFNKLYDVPYDMIDILSPQRILPLFGMEFFQENIKIIYNLIASKFQKKQAMPSKNGEHAIIEVEGRSYGAYMNEAAELYIVDITCTHLGATLHFNENEKTWDCPCHGSRFSYSGQVLNGPATNPLIQLYHGKNHIDPHLFD